MASVGTLEFVLENYRGEVFGKWLDHLLGTTFNHGSKLVEMLGDTGMTDNVYAADKLLAAADKEGWIQKAGSSPTPTVSQRFLGIGGVSGSSPSIAYHGSVWGWAPGPRAKEAQEWVSHFDWSSFHVDEPEDANEQQPKSKRQWIARLRTLVNGFRLSEADRLLHSAERANWERIKVIPASGAWYLCNREHGLIALVTFGGPHKEAAVFNWATTQWANNAAGWPKCEPEPKRESPIHVLPRRAPFNDRNQSKAARAFRALVKDADFDAADAAMALRTYWASIGGFLVEDGVSPFCRERWSLPGDPPGTTRVIRCTRSKSGTIEGVLISTESGDSRSVEPAPAALARLLRPRLNILDPDAFKKLAELEGASWAADERKHADEPGRFFDAQDAYRILKEAGLADTHDLAEVADSPGFIGSNGEIYVIARDGEILLFSDTAPDITKLARAKRMLSIVPSGLEHQGDVSWLQAGEAHPGMIVFSETSSPSAPNRSRPLEVTKVTGQSVYVVPINARKSKPTRYMWSEYNGQYQRKTKVPKQDRRAWRKTRYDTVILHLVRERKGTKS